MARARVSCPIFSSSRESKSHKGVEWGHFFSCGQQRQQDSLGWCRRGAVRAVAGSSSQEPALPVWRPAHFTRVWEPHVHAVCAYGAWTRPLVCQRCRSLYLTDGSTYSSEGPWESRDSGTSAGSGRKSAGLSEGTGAQPPSALYSRVCSVP